MAENNPETEPATEAETAGITSEEALVEDALVEAELLVEDVSIDGMCGVY